MPGSSHALTGRTWIIMCLPVAVLLGLAAHAWWPSGDGAAGAAPSAPSAPSATAPTAATTTPTATPSTRSSSTRSTGSRATASPSGRLLPPAVAGRRLSGQLAALFGPGDSFSVAGYDLTSGRTVTAGATSGMSEASVVKLDILETALYRQQLGDGFDPDDAAAMMEQSDNAAADDVFVSDGGNSGLSQYNGIVGLGSTVLEPSGTWGLSTTSATDQLQLMRQLVSSSSPLNAASRQYALQLMGDVESDQDWGVSAAADPGAQTRLKNGWLNIDDDGGLWAVNSVGLTTSGGHTLLLVVLSQHQPDYQTGVDRVGTAARELAAALTGTG